MNNLTISFCVTCKNRLNHLKQSLPFNLSQLNKKEKICLVNYGSTDDMSNWVWSNFSDQINNGKICFFDIKENIPWHMAKAKNVAHRIADTDYLFSLDADNFITKKDILNIRNTFNNFSACQQFSGKWEDGSCGRIGVFNNVFQDIGGYNEFGKSMGGEDLDFLDRCEASGYKVNRKMPLYEKLPIQHGFEAKVIDEEITTSVLNYWRNMNAENIRLYNNMRKEIGNKIISFSSQKGLLNGKEYILEGTNKTLTFV